MKPFFVYLLHCADGSFYAGHTDDLAQRLGEHECGMAGGYTAERRPVRLVWSQETATREEALAAERRVKGWSRAKKEALIAGDWEALRALARSRTGLRQAQPEREMGAVRAGALHPVPAPVRPEPVEGPNAPHSVRPELVDGSGAPHPVRPELVEGPGAPEPRLRQAQPEREVEAVRAGALHPVPAPVRPEPVEGPNAPHSVRPELVEGPDAPNEIVAAVTGGQRRALAKAITLLESTRPDHRRQADALLNTLLPHTGRSLRLGISGVPGVGKSTFIEALGLALIERRGRRVAVLAIDPSSSLSGGSILGDKTRMERLSTHPQAYVRPSPASGTLGGVAEKTREAMLVCEAAGHDVVIVETVGVGQSEIAVAGMTDLFVLLQLPNAGDDLQAIKRGVMELADLIVVNKADLDRGAATRAVAMLTSALRLLGRHGDPAARGESPVLALSALNGAGLDDFLGAIDTRIAARRATGDFEARRRRQSRTWLWDIVEARLRDAFRTHPAVHAALPGLLDEIAADRVAPSAAARTLLDLYAPPT